LKYFFVFPFLFLRKQKLYSMEFSLKLSIILLSILKRNNFAENEINWLKIF